MFSRKCERDKRSQRSGAVSSRQARAAISTILRFRRASGQVDPAIAQNLLPVGLAYKLDATHRAATSSRLNKQNNQTS